MAPSKAPVPVPKKVLTKESPVEPEVVEVEKTLGESSSLDARLPCDYIPPRKYDSPPVTVPKNVNQILVMPNIPEEVMIDEDMLGKVPQLRYAYHDITNMEKLPELVVHYYLGLKVDPTTN
jgi:hypothetical protein